MNKKMTKAQREKRIKELETELGKLRAGGFKFEVDKVVYVNQERFSCRWFDWESMINDDGYDTPEADFIIPLRLQVSLKPVE